MKQNNSAYIIRTKSGKDLGPWEPHYGEPTESNLLIWFNKYNRRVGHKNRLLEPVEIIKANINRWVSSYSPTIPNKTNFVKVIVTGTHVNARLFIKENEVYKTLQEITECTTLDRGRRFGDFIPAITVSMRKVRINTATARKLSVILEKIKQAGLKQIEHCRMLVRQAA